MQSWGTGSRFDYRYTDREPSKSGVLGLLCAALGRDRHEPIADLAALRMGVRVDREGTLRYDYQTAMRVLRAKGGSGSDAYQGTVQSWRYYLADAAFLVGLEGSDPTLLQKLQAALSNPRWPLYLGRKGYLPSPPVCLPDGLKDASLEEALASYPPLTEPAPGRYRFALEEVPGLPVPEKALATRVRRSDQLQGPFAQRHFGDRYVWMLYAGRGQVPSVSI